MLKTKILHSTEPGTVVITSVMWALHLTGMQKEKNTQ